MSRAETGTQLVLTFKRVYGESFEYKDFAPRFKAELFDPDRWADLFFRIFD